MSFNLSPSLIRAYLECPRLAYWRYHPEHGRWRLTKEAQPERMWMGSAIDKCLEILYWHEDPNSSEAWDAMEEALIGTLESKYTQAALRALIRGYLTYWDDAFPADQRPVAHDTDGQPMVQVEFNWALTDEDGEDTGVNEKGFLDRIEADPRTVNGLTIVETKTLGEPLRDNSPLIWSHKHNPQVWTYLRAARRAGLNAVSATLELIRRPDLKVQRATPVEDRQYRKGKNAEEKAWAAADPQDPRLLFKTNRLEDETPQAYGERLRVRIEEDPTVWFKRVELYPTHVHLDELHTWQLTVLEHIQLSFDGDRNRAAQNWHACHKMGTCDMWPVCSSGQSPAAFPDLFYKDTPSKEAHHGTK